MSEYWKSTPKYWCKYCSIYVRDTRLERANHESTGKHQGAIKRSLRELHRGHERQEREKDQAKREVERLSGVVSGTPAASTWGRNNSSSNNSSSSTSRGGPPSQPALSQAERQRQLEQLAELGVNIPDELRGDMALAGEWTVTTTRVVRDDPDAAGRDSGSVEARATGVRKRERGLDGEEDEEQDAIRGLFKKPGRWGRDSRSLPTGDDEELDALLSIPLVKGKTDGEAKAEVKEIKEEEANEVKQEEDEQGEQGGAAATERQAGTGEEGAALPIKRDPDGTDAETKLLSPAPHASISEPAAASTLGSSSSAPSIPDAVPTVVFKKRRPKNARQK